MSLQKLLFLPLLFISQLTYHTAGDSLRRLHSSSGQACGHGYFLSRRGACRACPKCPEDVEVSAECEDTQDSLCVNRSEGFLKIECKEKLALTLEPLTSKLLKRTKPYTSHFCQHVQIHVLKIVNKPNTKDRRKKCFKKSKCQEKNKKTAWQRRHLHRHCQRRLRIPRCASPSESDTRELFTLSCTTKRGQGLVLIHVHSRLELNASESRQRAVQRKMEAALCSPLQRHWKEKKIRDRTSKEKGIPQIYSSGGVLHSQATSETPAVVSTEPVSVASTELPSVTSINYTPEVTLVLLSIRAKSPVRPLMKAANYSKRNGKNNEKAEYTPQTNSATFQSGVDSASGPPASVSTEAAAKVNLPGYLTTTVVKRSRAKEASGERNNEAISFEEAGIARSGEKTDTGSSLPIELSIFFITLVILTIAAFLVHFARRKSRKCFMSSSLQVFSPNVDPSEDSSEKIERGTRGTIETEPLAAKVLATNWEGNTEDKTILDTQSLPELPQELEFPVCRENFSGEERLGMARRREKDVLNLLNSASGYSKYFGNINKGTVENGGKWDEDIMEDYCPDSGVSIRLSPSRRASSETSNTSWQVDDSLMSESLGGSPRQSISSMESTSTESSVRLPIRLPLSDDWLKKDIEVAPLNLFPTYASSATTQTDSVSTVLEPAPMFCTQWHACHTFSSRGGTLQIRDSEAKLSVPPNAVKKGSYLDVRAATATDLPFIHYSLQLPENEIIMSPVVEFQADECFQFDRWVDITVPHFLPSSCIDDDVKVYHVDRNSDGGFRLLVLTSETVYEKMSKNNTGSFQSQDGDEADVDDGSLDVGFFRLLPNGQLLVKTKGFCGYFCTACNVQHSQLHLFAFGSHKFISRDQRNVKIFLYLWDKRIQLKDFQRDYLPGDIQTHSWLARQTLTIVEDPDFLNSLVILHFHIHDSCASDWRHALRRDSLDPIFPVKRQFVLGKVLHWKTGAPRCEEWLIENINGRAPDEIFQGYVDVVNITQRRLSSASDIINNDNNVTLFFDVKLEEKPTHSWNPSISAGESHLTQKVSDIPERKHQGTPTGVAPRDETTARSPIADYSLDCIREEDLFGDGPACQSPGLSGLKIGSNSDLGVYLEPPSSQCPWRLTQSYHASSEPSNNNFVAEAIIKTGAASP
ncbi:uncharacterized protein LOC112564983 isoform X2 [Pomacea canaliculata]|uniref:uncharacterized protein LOC112564983 isoform X2 n=1 Tax=Pomacea canaliculata TaxID=400727 RepID=UPI000D73E789|nr:uncharacterized protein LOC112564983 isoform X2 [Pomacea canaliculata]